MILSDDTGSKSWSEWEKDEHEYRYQPSFPTPSPARTTFYAREAGDDEKKFERLFALQHGRGQTYEGWDTQRVRQENIFTYRRGCVILSQAGVDGDVREAVLARLQRENLNGFSRYYEGVDGAALGFAALYQYPTQADAMDSYLVDVAEEVLDIDGEALIEYVWQKYGSTEG